MITRNLSIQTIMTSQTFQQNLNATITLMKSLHQKWDDEMHWCKSSKELPSWRPTYTQDEWLIHAEVCQSTWALGYIKFSYLSVPEQMAISLVNRRQQAQVEDIINLIDDAFIN